MNDLQDDEEVGCKLIEHILAMAGHCCETVVLL